MDGQSPQNTLMSNNFHSTIDSGRMKSEMYTSLLSKIILIIKLHILLYFFVLIVWDERCSEANGTVKLSTKDPVSTKKERKKERKTLSRNTNILKKQNETFDLILQILSSLLFQTWASWYLLRNLFICRLII